MKLARRRRRENKTNYLKRIKLLKSEAPRVVFRKTNKTLGAQYVESLEAKDKVVFGLNSKILLKYGWPKSKRCSIKSMSASYLIGLLMGKEIKNRKLSTPILDFGLQRVLKGSNIQGFIKGIVDSGLKIKCNEDFFPKKDRIEGKHLKEKIPFSEIKGKILK